MYDLFNRPAPLSMDKSRDNEAAGWCGTPISSGRGADPLPADSAHRPPSWSDRRAFPVRTACRGSAGDVTGPPRNLQISTLDLVLPEYSSLQLSLGAFGALIPLINVNSSLCALRKALLNSHSCHQNCYRIPYAGSSSISFYRTRNS